MIKINEKARITSNGSNHGLEVLEKTKQKDKTFVETWKLYGNYGSVENALNGYYGYLQTRKASSDNIYTIKELLMEIKEHRKELNNFLGRLK